MTQQDALATMIAKEEIRELALLYSRGVDRCDIDLLATLYTDDGTDDHGPYYKGSAQGYIAYLAASLPQIHYSGHHVCNHLISVDGDEANGEVYCIAMHISPDGKGGFLEDVMAVRYVDRYRRCEDGKWRFSSRVVSFDLNSQRPLPLADTARRDPLRDPSVTELTHRLFARGRRAD